MLLSFRMDRVTIKEREEIENEEERIEKEKQRQTELRKKESRRVSVSVMPTYSIHTNFFYPGSN